MNKKLKIIISISVLATIFVLAAHFLLQNRDHIQHLTLTERECLLILPLFGGTASNPLREDRTHLFEFRQGNYEIRSYHYQLGQLVSEQVVVDLFDVHERFSLLSIGATALDGTRIRFDMNGEWFTRLDIVELEIDQAKLGVEASGVITDNLRLPVDEERIFLYFFFSEGGTIHSNTIRNIERSLDYRPHIDVLSGFDHVVLFTARRLD